MGDLSGSLTATLPVELHWRVVILFSAPESERNRSTYMTSIVKSTPSDMTAIARYHAKK